MKPYAIPLLALLAVLLCMWGWAMVVTVRGIVREKGATTVPGIAWIALVCMSSLLGMLLYWFYRDGTEDLTRRFVAKLGLR